MTDKDERDPFDIIRNGTEDEAREQYDRMRAAALRAAAVAIMARNNSHGIGKSFR